MSPFGKKTDGRVLSIVLKIDSLSVNLVNIYAPTVPADRKTFQHHTGIVEVTGSNPVEALIFSGFFFPIA